METGIAKAIRIAGSQTALGNLLGLTPQAVQKWASQGFVPGDRCREVEAVLGHRVSRYELNPAVFGEDPTAASESSVHKNEESSFSSGYGRRKDDFSSNSTS